MKTISKRELNQDTAGVLDAVKNGRPVIVTERGVARWRIEALETSTDTVARLRAEGRITPAKAMPAPWPVAKARYTPAQVDALFAESRGDR
jgi:antitoxin (DNA-binding transcriptional repressor) of toxin-antitoxin stability system